MPLLTREKAPTPGKRSPPASKAAGATSRGAPGRNSSGGKAKGSPPGRKTGVRKGQKISSLGMVTGALTDAVLQEQGKVDGLEEKVLELRENGAPAMATSADAPASTHSTEDADRESKPVGDQDSDSSGDDDGDEAAAETTVVDMRPADVRLSDTTSNRLAEAVVTGAIAVGTFFLCKHAFAAKLRQGQGFFKSLASVATVGVAAGLTLAGAARGVIKHFTSTAYESKIVVEHRVRTDQPLEAAYMSAQSKTHPSELYLARLTVAPTPGQQLGIFNWTKFRSLSEVLCPALVPYLPDVQETRKTLLVDYHRAASTLHKLSGQRSVTYDQVWRDVARNPVVSLSSSTFDHLQEAEAIPANAPLCAVPHSTALYIWWRLMEQRGAGAGVAARTMKMFDTSDFLLGP